MEVNQEVMASIGTSLLGLFGWLWLRKTGAEKQKADALFDVYKRENEHKIEELTSDVERLRDVMQDTRETYLSKTDFNGAIDRLTNQLERIEKKIDQK